MVSPFFLTHGVFSLNKWQYHDEYIIVVVILWEKWGKIITKKLQKSSMSGI